MLSGAAIVVKTINVLEIEVEGISLITLYHVHVCFVNLSVIPQPCFSCDWVYFSTICVCVCWQVLDWRELAANYLE